MLTVHHGGILGQAEEDTLPGENVAETLPKFPFDYMFKDLQGDPENFLPESEPKTTVARLRYVGREAMSDPVEQIPGIRVPAIHTFLAQFIDHDITLMDDRGAPMSLANPTPLSPAQIKKIVNARSPNLDLDNIYGPNIDPEISVPKDDDPRKLKLGTVKYEDGLPKEVNPDGFHDFPRLNGKTALIGDSRDAENLILAQLHVAFLRAHNAIVDEYHVEFEDARRLLIQHYQWIVLDDFLKQICDPDIVETIRDGKPNFFNPSPASFYMPLEFAVAVYRFGHSKVRPSYDEFNTKQPSGLLSFLFGFSHRPLLDNWVISWPSFLDTENEARIPRRIDTTLSSPLLDLHNHQLNGHDPQVQNLAVRNLLRGYMLRIPTGQAVARAMKMEPMTDEIIAVAKQIPVSDGKTQADFLDTEFVNKTPLWFYILAEAARYGENGKHLGPVGSTIVAEVLIGILRNSTHSILNDPDWKGPTLKGETPGKFDIKDLLILAGVL